MASLSALITIVIVITIINAIITTIAINIMIVAKSISILNQKQKGGR